MSQSLMERIARVLPRESLVQSEAFTPAPEPVAEPAKPPPTPDAPTRRCELCRRPWVDGASICLACGFSPRLDAHECGTCDNLVPLNSHTCQTCEQASAPPCDPGTGTSTEKWLTCTRARGHGPWRETKGHDDWSNTHPDQCGEKFWRPEPLPAPTRREVGMLLETAHDADARAEVLAAEIASLRAEVERLRVFEVAIAGHRRRIDSAEAEVERLTRELEAIVKLDGQFDHADSCDRVEDCEDRDTEEGCRTHCEDPCPACNCGVVGIDIARAALAETPPPSPCVHGTTTCDAVECRGVSNG